MRIGRSDPVSAPIPPWVMLWNYRPASVRINRSMLKRIYVSNFRNLVNFELCPGELSLLMGPNGSGKSAVLDLLARLCAYVVEGASVDSLFPEAKFNRWAQGEEVRQVHELDLAANGGRYRYRLVLRLLRSTGQVRMEEEQLRF